MRSRCVGKTPGGAQPRTGKEREWAVRTRSSALEEEGSRESGKAPGDLYVSCRSSKFLLERSGHESGVARAWAVETTLWLQRRMNLGGYRDEEVNSTEELEMGSGRTGEKK